MAVYQRKSNEILAANVDGDVIIMDPRCGEYFGLNGVAGFIWEQLEEPVSKCEIVERLTREYEVPIERCEQDVERFLESGIKADLFERVSPDR